MIESLISDTQSLQNKLKAYWSARPIEALASMREGGIVYLHLYHKRENCQCWNTRLVWPSLKRLKQVLITRLLRPFNLPTYTTNNYDILDTFDTLIPLQWSCETDKMRSRTEVSAAVASKGWGGACSAFAGGAHLYAGWSSILNDRSL